MAIATIILEDGSKVSLDVWQQMYGLRRGSNEVGKYFKVGEPHFVFGMEVSSILIKLLDRVREIRKEPSIINSLGRNHAKQLELVKNGNRAASVSTHEFNIAADHDTKSNAESDQLVKVIEQAAKELKIKVRIGCEDYKKKGQTLVHVDVAPEYFAKGKPWHHIAHPEPFEREARW